VAGTASNILFEMFFGLIRNAVVCARAIYKLSFTDFWSYCPYFTGICFIDYFMSFLFMFSANLSLITRREIPYVNMFSSYLVKDFDTTGELFIKFNIKFERHVAKKYHSILPMESQRNESPLENDMELDDETHSQPGPDTDNCVTNELDKNNVNNIMDSPDINRIWEDLKTGGSLSLSILSNRQSSEIKYFRY
jgi:hypothetical protein